tara:strand:- start:8561 stop:9916 length:1356 start_codon:yes stop_codon:yes gene_type:complete
VKQVLVLKQQRTLSDFGGRMPTQILPSRASRIQSEGQQIRDDEQNITPDELIDMYVSDKRDDKQRYENIDAKREIKDVYGDEYLERLRRNVPVIAESLEDSGMQEPITRENIHRDKEIRQEISDLANTYPSLQELISRQTTLPEHLPQYHTEDWLDSSGRVKPGAVPPITALRWMQEDDTMDIMGREGAGLLPLLFRDSNQNYEAGNKLPFALESNNPPLQQYQGGNFITGPAIADLDNVATGGHNTGRRMVGIRGYGYPSGDDFQSRPVMGQQEGLNEGLTSSKVPANRLVPFRYSDAQGVPQHVDKNEMINFFMPRKVSDYYNSLYGDTPMQNVLRDTSQLQYAPTQFDGIVDRFGLPEGLTEEQKFRLIHENNPEFGKVNENIRDEMASKLRQFRQLGTNVPGSTQDEEEVPRNVLQPPQWGQAYEHMMNMPQESKDAIIESLRRKMS